MSSLGTGAVFAFRAETATPTSESESGWCASASEQSKQASKQARADHFDDDFHFCIVSSPFRERLLATSSCPHLRKTEP